MVDPLAKKEFRVSQWAESLQRRGLPVPATAIERQVQEDLRLVERARSEGLIKRKHRKQKNKLRPGVARPDIHAEALANQTGTKFFARAVPELETAAPALTALRGVDAERNLALSKRIKLLTSKGDGRLLAGKALHQGQWEFPAFAREIALTTLCFQMRLGSYKELSADDRRRRYIAAMTDIADRSNAVVGYGWWVKR
jgi:hypothetical protein